MIHLDYSDYVDIANMFDGSDIGQDIWYEKDDKAINIICDFYLSFECSPSFDYDVPDDYYCSNLDLNVRYVKADDDNDFDEDKLYDALCDRYGYPYKRTS